MSTSESESGYAWSEALIQRCLDAGIDAAFMAPGARCTPLVRAVAARSAFRVFQHIDERGLAYAALGYGRAMGRPALIITTSGTAVANLLPAVVEAREESVPLLVLAADRPARLRGTCANQTIDQADIFKAHATVSVDLAMPPTLQDTDLFWADIDHALLAARCGPAHINWQIEDPFAHASPVGQPGRVFPSRVKGDAVLPEIPDAERGLVILGGMQAPLEIERVRDFALRRGWPVLADICSGLRGALGADLEVAPYDALLDPVWVAEHAPECIVHLGGRLVSKRLAAAARSWRPVATYVHCWDGERTWNPDAFVTQHISTDPASLLAVKSPDFAPKDSAWLSAWIEGASRFSHGDAAGLLEPLLADAIWRELRDGEALSLGNSLAVRDFDLMAGPAAPKDLRVCSTRGASGIDGNISAALGFSWALERRITIVVGDLTALHDLNALAALARHAVPVCLVVVNNDGGSIFRHLPVAHDEGLFEQYFLTPQGVDLRDLATAFGVDGARVESLDALRATYRRWQASDTHLVIDAQTDGEASARARGSLLGYA